MQQRCKNRKILPSSLILCPFNSNRMVILSGSGAIGFEPIDLGAGNVHFYALLIVGHSN
jgi:hypothetical protein